MIFFCRHYIRAAIVAATLAVLPVVAHASPASPAIANDSDAASVPAQGPALAAARDLIDSMGMTRGMEARFPNIAESLCQLSQRDPLVVPTNFDVRETALQLLKAHKEETFNQIAELYTGVFTTEELRTLSAFYRSPFGVRLKEFSTALEANRNPDRKKAAEESKITVGITPTEMAQIGSRMQSAGFEKLLKTKTVILAAIDDIGRKLGVRISIEIKELALRKRGEMRETGRA